MRYSRAKTGLHRQKNFLAFEKPSFIIDFYKFQLKYLISISLPVFIRLASVKIMNHVATLKMKLDNGVPRSMDDVATLTTKDHRS